MAGTLLLERFESFFDTEHRFGYRLFDLENRKYVLQISADVRDNHFVLAKAGEETGIFGVIDSKKGCSAADTRMEREIKRIAFNYINLGRFDSLENHLSIDLPKNF